LVAIVFSSGIVEVQVDNTLRKLAKVHFFEINQIAYIRYNALY
jgi:hypothetical protein